MKTAASHNRQPAVAGQFYPAQPTELEQSLDACFAQTTVMVGKPVRALICPHAGYVFSGHVAATAFAQLNQRYKRVFLLGPPIVGRTRESLSFTKGISTCPTAPCLSTNQSARHWKLNTRISLLPTRPFNSRNTASRSFYLFCTAHWVIRYPLFPS